MRAAVGGAGVEDVRAVDGRSGRGGGPGDVNAVRRVHRHDRIAGGTHTAAAGEHGERVQRGDAGRSAIGRPSVRRLPKGDAAGGDVAVLEGDVDVAVRRDGDERALRAEGVDGGQEDRLLEGRAAVRRSRDEDEHLARLGRVGVAQVEVALVLRGRARVDGQPLLVEEVDAAFGLCRGVDGRSERRPAVGRLGDADRRDRLAEEHQRRVVGLAVRTVGDDRVAQVGAVG